MPQENETEETRDKPELSSTAMLGDRFPYGSKHKLMGRDVYVVGVVEYSKAEWGDRKPWPNEVEIWWWNDSGEISRKILRGEKEISLLSA